METSQAQIIHKLKNALTALSIELELALGEQPTPDESKQLLESSLTELRSIQALVNKLH